MRTCNDIQSNLSRFLDNDLSGERAATVAAHLNHCTVCRFHHDNLQQIRTTLGNLPAPGNGDLVRARVFTHLERSIQQAPVAHVGSHWHFALPSFQSVWRPTLVTAMAAACGLGVLLMARPHSTESQPLPAPTEMSLLYQLHDARSASLVEMEPVTRRAAAADARATLLNKTNDVYSEIF